MSEDEARLRFAAARVARLATADAEGVPHVVPVVFAVDRDTIVVAVDHKPKRTTALKRLANVRANPRVALLADHYADDDWDALWWVRADGAGTVHEPAGRPPRTRSSCSVSATRSTATAARACSAATATPCCWSARHTSA